jgi:hypothetical protein
MDVYSQYSLLKFAVTAASMREIKCIQKRGKDVKVKSSREKVRKRNGK